MSATLRFERVDPRVGMAAPAMRLRLDLGEVRVVADVDPSDLGVAIMGRVGVPLLGWSLRVVDAERKGTGPGSLTVVTGWSGDDPFVLVRVDLPVGRVEARVTHGDLVLALAGAAVDVTGTSWRPAA